MAIIGLVCSIPFSLMKHLSYREGYVGASDGLTVEVIDFWMFWLAADYCLSPRRTSRNATELAPILLPIAFSLLADALSLMQSEDLILSAYGLISHVRAVILFVVLTMVLAQGEEELRSALLGVVSAVLTVGLICIAEMVAGANVRSNALVDEMTDYSVFRSAGLQTPTNTAGYLITLLPIVCLVALEEARFRRRLARLALVCGGAGLLCTLSRGAIGILLIGSFPLLAYLIRRRWIRPLHVIISILFLGFVGIALGDKLMARLGEGADDMNGRNGLNSTAVNMAISSPIVGVGVNTYSLSMSRYAPRDQVQRFEYLVHSKYLLLFAETGALGLASFLGILGVAMRRAASLASSGSAAGVAFFSSMIILLIHMNLESYADGPLLLSFWVCLSLLAAFWNRRERIVLQKNAWQIGVPATFSASR